MSEKEKQNLQDFFDINEKDTQFLLELTKELGHRIRLIFDPPFYRNKTGTQNVPTRCKIIVEAEDEVFAQYVLYELEKNRTSRSTTKSALTSIFKEKN